MYKVKLCASFLLSYTFWCFGMVLASGSGWSADECQISSSNRPLKFHSDVMHTKNHLIEELAQKQFKYSKLFEDQAAILRKDPIVYQTAYGNVSRSEGIAKEGQQWMPKADEKDAYMKHLEDICAIEPKTPDDRMKICFAAYAFTTCLILLDIGQLSSKDQYKIIERYTELQAVEMAKLPTAFMPLSLGLESDFPKPQIPTHPQMHEVTEKELLAFLKNPCDLIGKQFELRDRRTQDDLFYEVVKLGVSKGKSHCFGVQFADCGGVVEMESDEMKMLLQESYQVDN